MASSYDKLLKQVQSLTAENSHLKKELKDNSHQLSQLETEASSMKDALLQLQASTQCMQEDIVHQHVTSELKVRASPLIDLSRLSSSPLMNEKMQHHKDEYKLLEKERYQLLAEQENEEKLKAWYMNHLQNLKRRLEELPLTDNQYSSMARRQIEIEMTQLRDVMAKSLGSPEDVTARQRKRAIRLHLIEQELKDVKTRGGGDNSKDPGQRNSSYPNHISGQSNNQDGDIIKHQSGLPNGFHNSFNMSLQNAGQVNDPYNPYAHLSSDGSLQRPSSVGGQSSIPPAMMHGVWPITSQVQSLKDRRDQHETSSLASFNSANSAEMMPRKVPAQFGTKVDMVYSLLSMLGTHDKDDMSRTLLAMSSSQDSCIAMRESGCLPLLIQLLHGPDRDLLIGVSRENQDARARASTALHNIVHSHPDEAKRKQESRILRLLEQIRAYCDDLMERNGRDQQQAAMDHNPGPSMAALMKHSFDEEYRSAICQLGGLQAIAELLQVDFEIHGDSTDQYVLTLRRYAGMALTNLTFGDVTNKALLCSMKGCMRALVAQLKIENEDLRQVAASVLRNLSWRADMASKRILRDIGAVAALMKCALEVNKESTLKSVLSALWNLSAHCTENKADICAVEGALKFLVSTLTYKSPSRNWAVVENGGGILRNVSSHIATNEEYRGVLREHNCLQILLRHLKSSSLTIVSNACGTLWNLSARNKEDQDLLWELGAVSMLKNLVHSKHKMIAMGSSAALRNLMSARPDLLAAENQKDGQPTLHVRKQRALEAEIDKNLRNSQIDPDEKSKKRYSYSFPRQGQSRQSGLPMSQTMPSMQGNPDQSPVPQRIPIWNNRVSVPDGVQLRSAQRQKAKSNDQLDAGPKIDYQPYGLGNKVEDNQAVEESDSNSGRSRIAKVMQEVAQHSPKTSRNSRTTTNHAISAHNSPSTPRDVHSQFHPSQQFTNGPDTNPQLTNRSNSYCFGLEGQLSGVNRKSSQESIHSVSSDIYPAPSHERQFPINRPQDRAHSAENGLNLDNRSVSNIVQHSAIVHRSAEEDLNAEADSIIDFSLKYSEENAQSKNSKKDGLQSREDKLSNPIKQSIKNEECNSTYDKDNDAGSGFQSIPTHLPNIHCVSFPEEPEENQMKQRVHEDGTKTYCVEDTPVVFSRCSSLSSLESDHNENEEKNEEDAETPSATKDGDEMKTEEQQNEAHTPEEAEHEHHVECHIEDTPLIFSRCSSVSSLSSVEVQDICDDNASVCSDSRRQSEVVSPSDLPDSPSQTMPQSPRRSRSNSNRPVSVTETKPVLPDSDEGKVYRDEGDVNAPDTCATSLSALTIDDEEKAEAVCKLIDAPENGLIKIQENSKEESGDAIDEDCSQITDLEQDMLDACINSALPPKKTGVKAKSKVKAAASKGGAGNQIGAPFTMKKENDGAADGTSTFKTEGTPVNFSTSTSLSDLTIEDIEIEKTDEGKLKIVNPEKRGVKFEVQLEEGERMGRHERGDGDDKEADDSILEACINSAMPKNKSSKSKIPSTKKAGRGIPKLRGGKTSAMLRKRIPVAELRLKSPSPIPEMSSDAKSTSSQEWPGSVSPAPDTVQTFCVEGTPGLSKASSWGDLTEQMNQEDIINGNAPAIQQDIKRSSYGGVGKKTATAAPKGLTAASKFSTGSTPLDSPKLYGVEGTPVTFSRSDSLSSLSCDEDAELSDAKAEMRSKRREGDGAAAQSIPSSNNRLDAPGINAFPGRKSNFSYDTPLDSPHVFMVEGTPLSYSRKGSLSDLSCDEEDEGNDLKKQDGKSAKELLAQKRTEGGVNKTSKEPGQLRQQYLNRLINPEDTGNHELDHPEPVAEESELLQENEEDSSSVPTKPSGRENPRAFAVEDTPVCFSRNSSLSSLSIDSDDENNEQALLEQCISSGMPEGKKKGSGLPKMIRNKTWDEDDFKPYQDKSTSNKDLAAEVPVQRRGPRITKPGESSVVKQDDGPKSVRGGKKTYRSPITGQARSVTPPKSISGGGKVNVPKQAPKVVGGGGGVKPVGNAAKKTQGITKTPVRNASPASGIGRGKTQNKTPPKSGTSGIATPPRTVSPAVRSAGASPNNSGTNTPARNTVTTRSLSPAGRGRPTAVKTTPAKNFTSNGPTNRSAASKATGGWNNSVSVPKPQPPKFLGNKPPAGGKSPATGTRTPGTKSPATAKSKSPATSRTQSPAISRAGSKTTITTSRSTSPSSSTKSTPSPSSKIPGRRGSAGSSITSSSMSPGTTRKPLSLPKTNTPSTNNSNIKQTSAPVKKIPARSKSASPASSRVIPTQRKNSSTSPTQKEGKQNGEKEKEEKSNESSPSEQDPPKLLKQSTFTKDSPSLPVGTDVVRKDSRTALDDIVSEAGSDGTSHSSSSITISNGGWRRTSRTSQESCDQSVPGLEKDSDCKKQTGSKNGNSENGDVAKATVKGEVSKLQNRTPVTVSTSRTSSPMKKQIPTSRPRTGSNASNSPATNPKIRKGAMNRDSPPRQTGIKTSVTKKPMQSLSNVSKNGDANQEGLLKSNNSNQPPDNSQNTKAGRTKLGKADLCKEMGIPIHNKGGNVVSPSNESIRMSGIWLKQEEDIPSTQGSETELSRHSSQISIKSSSSALNKSRQSFPKTSPLKQNGMASQEFIYNRAVSNVERSSGNLSDKLPSPEKKKTKSTDDDASISENSQSSKDEKKKKRFSFLKLKVGKKKGKDGEEKKDKKECTKQEEKEAAKKAKKKSKLFKKSKQEKKQTEDTETQTDNEENLCNDTDQSESACGSSHDKEYDLDASFHCPDMNFDRRLDELENWNSDDDIGNEVMPDEFEEWDSDNDISKEELPVFSETCSEADPLSLEYGVNSQYNSPPVSGTYNLPQSNLIRNYDSDYRDESGLRRECGPKNLRSQSLSEALDDQKNVSVPSRPQRLRLPKKPFGMNRSDTSPPTTAVLVSPFNYSPKALKIKENGVEKRNSDGMNKSGCQGEGDDGLLSPGSLSRMTTV